MTTRQTSIEAYRTIAEKGLLSQSRWRVYDMLYRRGPLTASQTFLFIAQESHHRPNFDSNTRARFTELRECGAIAEVGHAKDPITGMTVILWDVTDRIPTPFVKSVPTKKIIADLRQRVTELEAENSKLKTQTVFEAFPLEISVYPKGEKP